ncbi:hypothetical protein KA017_00445 [Candidatus Woesebacteria bacterium]|nr:hypothetical protein [Candidatus Woesebacteria bacterium]
MYQSLVSIVSVLGIAIFIASFYQSKYKKNPYGLTRILLPFGIFVWGDGVVLGLFWFLTGLVSLFIPIDNLFYLIFTLFWVVRSAGEILYWFLQQFSTVERDPPHTLPFANIFPGQSVWFAYQVIWQCVLVISLVALFYIV